MKRELNWEFIRNCLKVRKEAKKLTALGFKKHETDWEIVRGGLRHHVIAEAKVSACGKYVWTRLAAKEGT